MIKKGTGLRQITENRRVPLPPLTVLVVAGVRKDRCREILGARVMECGNGEFWSGLFEDLRNLPV